MATMTVTVSSKIKDADSLSVGAEVNGTEDYSGGDFVVSQFSVADSTTDHLIDLGELATAGVMRIYIESDQAVTITPNSTSDTDLPLPAGCAMVLYFTTAETNFYVTNASGSSATITVYAIGASS
jgi:hypothetical protein